MADKVHRRPVAPGGFTQAPLTSTAVWRGITNSLARTLFADNIVKAAPGFNAGMGRHVRAQEYADYMRNWETSRPSKTGVDQDGNTVYVG